EICACPGAKAGVRRVDPAGAARLRWQLQQRKVEAYLAKLPVSLLSLRARRRNLGLPQARGIVSAPPGRLTMTGPADGDATPDR
ncbi:MAG TPA: hypothetical protein VGF07_13600, partial [Stellaceae bacterium]